MSAKPLGCFRICHAKDDQNLRNIKSITDFGIFIGLTGNIDGLGSLVRYLWTEAGEDAVRHYNKGDEIETVILAIDSERERISLGVKQLEDDPFSNYVAENDRGAIVTGEVVEVDAKSVTIKLAEEVEGILKAADIGRDKVEEIFIVSCALINVEAKIIAVDRKTRALALSIKAKDFDDEKEAVKSLKDSEGETASPGTIGDLIKAQMSDK